MALRLTRAGDYAVRAMIHIGSLPDGGVALKDEIALAEGIPPSFMAKILRQLVRTGLLRSARGVHGGFGLARGAGDISLLDVVEAIEGPIQLTDCSPDPERCTLSHDCPASGVWLEVQQRMTGLLRETSLEALLSAPRRNRRVMYRISG
ncbi:MAG TPA: Rrf2 family transcriptional regulator [Candidatus Polarisedimenticolaceae bacterium]|nr:Rrf2 family transcriptional regulator [Candidatus Polarisedimenticolaceae bacterium]